MIHFLQINLPIDTQLRPSCRCLSEIRILRKSLHKISTTQSSTTMSTFSFMVDFYDEVEEEKEEWKIKQENAIKCEFCNLKVEENDIERHNCFTIDQTIIQEEKIELDSEGNDEFQAPLNATITEVEEFKCEKLDLPEQHKTKLSRKLFKCLKCDFKCKRRKYLKSHIIRRHQNPDEIKWFKCKKCYYKCKIRVDLRKHNKYKHGSAGDINWFKCEKCDYKSKEMRYLKRHITHKHADPNPPVDIKWFKCDKCGWKCMLKQDLKTHVYFKHASSRVQPSRIIIIPGEEKLFQCEKCAFKCKSEENFNSHAVEHQNPAEIKWFKCEKCDFKCTQAIDFLNHISIKHPDPTTVEMRIKILPGEVKWFKCEKCVFKCKWLWGLELHKARSHLNADDTHWVQCEKYPVKDDLNRGAVVKHQNINLLQCEKCDFKCKWLWGLELHKARTHFNADDTHWVQCEKYGFKDYSNRRAVVEHKNINLWQCEKCDFTCKGRENLVVHSVLKHINPEQILYQCQKCSYKSPTEENLKNHMNCKHYK